MALAMLAALTGLVGTGISAYGQIEEGRTKGRIAAANAQQAEEDAIAAEESAEYKSFLLRQESHRLQGKQKVGYASAGVDVGVGSPLDVMYETARNLELDRIVTEQEGERQARAFRREAGIQRLMGKQARRAGTLGAISTVLGGGANFASVVGR